MPKRSRVLSSASCAILLACSITSPSQPADGDYVLIKYGASPLPANIEQLPNRDLTPSGCWLTLAEGTLSLNSTGHSFHYNLIYKNSCDGTVLGTGDVSGQFEQSGDNLTFQAVGGNPPFSGKLTAGVVIVQREAPFLYFAKVP